MFTKTEVKKILEETIGEYVFITEELIKTVMDDFNEILLARKKSDERPCVSCYGTGRRNYLGENLECNSCSGKGFLSK